MSPDTLHEPEEAHEPPGAVTPKKAALASRRLARQARGERWTRPAGRLGAARRAMAETYRRQYRGEQV
jgi:hypothetical protein